MWRSCAPGLIGWHCIVKPAAWGLLQKPVEDELLKLSSLNDAHASTLGGVEDQVQALQQQLTSLQASVEENIIGVGQALEAADASCQVGRMQLVTHCWKLKGQLTVQGIHGFSWV